MHTNPNQLWLAGWYTIPGEQVQFTSHHHPVSPWPEASTWLREEMHQQASFWEPSECFSLHVETGQVMGNLGFDNCLDFIGWATANRQDRGVWGRDAHRCYYLIAREGGEETPAPTTVTTPLTMHGKAPMSRPEENLAAAHH